MDHLTVARNIAKLMDEEFDFLGFKFGLDPIVGLIPGFGDAISLVFSLYIVWIAFQMRVPHQHISQMISNLVFDFVLGLIPVVGDVSDFFYKANKKNMEILERYAQTNVYEGRVI